MFGFFPTVETEEFGRGIHSSHFSNSPSFQRGGQCECSFAALLRVPSNEPKEFRHGITGGISSRVTINPGVGGKRIEITPGDRRRQVRSLLDEIILVATPGH